VAFSGKQKTVVSKLRSIEELFAGRHFDREVIILCVRWYLCATTSATATWSR
jgi:transposase-like protein